MTVKKDDWVFVEYTGKVASTGELFDTNKDRDPLKFKVGASMVIPGFDVALIDMKEGEEKEFTIPCSQAYGEKNTQIVEIPKTSFQDTSKLEIGKEFVVNTNFGPMLIEVKEMEEEKIKVILNHPLAGKDLLFNIKLVKILDEEESKQLKEKMKTAHQHNHDHSCGEGCESCAEKDGCCPEEEPEESEEPEEPEQNKPSEEKESK